MPRNPSRVATPRSTAPSRRRGNSGIRALKALILVAALIWVGKMIVDAVSAIRGGTLTLDIHPGWLALSGAIVLLTYFVLIRAWLYILEGLSGRSLPLLTGARIWFISNLGTLLPGRVWGIIQMGAMSVEQGINPVAAGAASVINAAVNISTGLAIGAITGAPILAQYAGGHAWLAWALAALSVAGVCAIPVILPWIFRRLGDRVAGSAAAAEVPARVLVVSAAANILSWVMYGAAFLCLARGVLDGVQGGVLQHTAAFATSYVIGYLFLIVPMGMGVRESALQAVLVSARLTTAPQALALSVFSRFWLLIIQVLPALIFLAYRRPRPDETASHAG